MATAPNRTRRNNSSRAATDGNLARRIDRQQELERRLERSGQLDFDKQYRRRRETQAEQLSRQRAKAKAAIRPAQHVSPVLVVGFITVAVMLVGLLMCYIQLNTISRSIVSMKSEISALETQQVTLRTQYERTFDMTTVKSAAESAGMTAPNGSQIYYITLPGEDHAVAYSGETGGMFDAITSSLRQWFGEVVEYFR